MKRYQEIKTEKYELCGVTNPDAWLWENVNGVYLPQKRVDAVVTPKDEVKTIDVTPTWESTLHMMLAVVQDGNDKGKIHAIKQLQHMARVADMYVEVSKNCVVMYEHEGHREIERFTGREALQMAVQRFNEITDKYKNVQLLFCAN